MNNSSAMIYPQAETNQQHDRVTECCLLQNKCRKVEMNSRKQKVKR